MYIQFLYVFLLYGRCALSLSSLRFMGLEFLKHAQRERILFLDQCHGVARLNRRDLILRFDISTAQAAVDFRTYLSLTETPPVYDAAEKTYFSSGDHRALSSVGPEQVFHLLSEETSDLGTSIPLPSRSLDPAIIAPLHRAMKNERDIQITYTSMNSGLSEPQWITPVRFHFDGEAMHLRECQQTRLPRLSPDPNI